MSDNPKTLIAQALRLLAKDAYADEIIADALMTTLKQMMPDHKQRTIMLSRMAVAVATEAIGLSHAAEGWYQQQVAHSFAILRGPDAGEGN